MVSHSFFSVIHPIPGTEFEVTVSPAKFEVSVGQKITFTCNVYPPAQSRLPISYRWSRADNLAMSSSAVGINTNALTIVRANNK